MDTSVIDTNGYDSLHDQIIVLITTISLVIVFFLIYLFFIFRRRSTNLEQTNIEMTVNTQQPHDQLNPICINDLGMTEAIFDPHSDTVNPYGMHRCHFCQEDFCEGEPIGSLAGCNHIYHIQCLADSVTSNFTTCPVCRQNMISISVEGANRDNN